MWCRYEAIHLLRRDPRFKISSVYSLKAHAAEEFVSKLNERCVFTFLLVLRQKVVTLASPDDSARVVLFRI